MATSLDSLVNKPIPEKLWHYTSIQGFQGIVTSKTIFATDVRFLNDKTEFIHAREIAAQVIAEMDEFGANQFPARDHAQKAVDLAFEGGMLSAERIQVFVASFSEAEDQLSQWRGYSQGSSGVSLAFDLTKLRPPAGIGTLVTLAPCVYGAGEKKTLLRESLSYFVLEAQGYWNEGFEAAEPIWRAGDRVAGQAIIDSIMSSTKFRTDIAEALVRTQADLLRVAALSKDQSFHEEREWRLVLPVDTGKTAFKNPPRFRPANTTLIPYIAHPFSSDPSAPLPLKDVVLGPGGHPNALQGALAFLKSQGLAVEPRESKVPYRPW